MIDAHAAFGERLQSAIDEMKIPLTLSDEQKSSFYIFYQDLVEKNKVMNLTSITEEALMRMRKPGHLPISM